MDGLGKKATKIFRDTQSFSGIHIARRITFTHNEDGEIGVKSDNYPCDHSRKGCTELLNPSEPDQKSSSSNSNAANDGGSECEPLLDLIVLSQPASLAIGLHAQEFHRIFERFCLEPHILYLIARNVDGFYRLPYQDEDPRPCLCYFIHIRGRYMVMWSYFPETARTKAIAITRPGVFGQVEAELQVHKQLLAGHPLALALVCCAQVIDGISREIGPELRAVAEVESKTGFNPFEDGSVASARVFGGRPDESFSILSGMMSNTGVVLALHSKYLGFAQGVLQELTRERLTESTWKEIIPTDRYQDYERLSHRIAEVSTMLSTECDMTLPYITLLKERVTAQQTVLGALIAKQQYAATINLAKDSRSIALASKVDSSSMKGLAFVTMAFLPATFFATLFAMPLLRWDASPVVQAQFWVYLACTLPITAVILVAWFWYSWRQRSKREELDRKERERVGTGLDQEPKPDAVHRDGVLRTPPIDSREDSFGTVDIVIPPRRRQPRLTRVLEKLSGN